MGKKFSELERAVGLNNGDLAAFAQVDQSAPTGYKSKAAPMSLVSQKILKETEYASDLQTDDKTVLGAINEVNSRTIAYDVVSGPIANFKTSLELPIKSLGIDVNAIQAAGKPTPASPLQISGRSEIKVGYVDFNQLARIAPATSMGATATIDNDGVISLSGVLTNSYTNITQPITVEADEIYLIGKVVVENPNNISFNWSFLNSAKTPSPSASAGTSWFVTKITSTTGPSTGLSGMTTGLDLTGIKIKIVCINLTKALGKEKADYIYSLPNYGIDVARALFTKDYYPYNAGGTLVSLNEVNDKVVCPVDVIALGGNYYGGHLTQDKDGHRQFVVTHAILEKAVANMNNTDAYPGWRNSGAKNIVGAEVSSFFTGVLNVGNGYSINTKGSNDIVYLPTGSYSMTQSQWIASYPDLIVQLLLPYAEPIIIDLPDGDPIITFNGINNIYADSGDASVEHALTIEEYIDKKIASVQALILNS